MAATATAGIFSESVWRNLRLSGMILSHCDQTRSRWWLSLRNGKSCSSGFAAAADTMFAFIDLSMSQASR